VQAGDGTRLVVAVGPRPADRTVQTLENMLPGRLTLSR
jgi:hypothetical protein